MNKHTTTVHARCPYLPVWDYYEVTVETSHFLRCEDVEKSAESVRGKTLTQEDVAKRLRETLPDNVSVVRVIGRHGANCLLEVTW